MWLQTTVGMLPFEGKIEFSHNLYVKYIIIIKNRNKEIHVNGVNMFKKIKSDI